MFSKCLKVLGIGDGPILLRQDFVEFRLKAIQPLGERGKRTERLSNSSRRGRPCLLNEADETLGSIAAFVQVLNPKIVSRELVLPFETQEPQSVC